MKPLRIRGALAPMKHWPSVVVDLLITEEKETGPSAKAAADEAASVFRRLGRLLERRREEKR